MKKKNEKLLVPQCLRNLVPFKKAFTLAEVLITLGIIGVVAALTIPTLVKDYQKKTYVAAFKKSHAELTEVFKRMRAAESVDGVMATALYNSKNDDSLWLGELRKYINVSEFKKDIPYSTLEKDVGSLVEPTILECSNLKCFQMQSGAIFMLSFNEPSGGYTARHFNLIDIALDVNGEKGPNQLGRDYFSFEVTDNGRIWAVGQEKPCGYEDDEDGISSALDCLASMIFSWQVSCNWDGMKNVQPSYKDYAKQSWGGGMTDEEFESEWNSASDEEKQAWIDDNAEGYAEYQQQIETFKMISQTGIGCAGRIMEEGAMNY